jgi:hypothetical protein
MKKVICLFVFLIFASTGFCQSFVNPIGFVETDSSKAKVIAFIKKQAQNEYAQVGGDQSLKTMENASLRAFKKLTKVTNTTLLNQMIKKYAETELYPDYRTILVEYKQQNHANLKW